MIVKVNTCPHCGGRLAPERYDGDVVRRCAQCGRSPDCPARPPTSAEKRERKAAPLVPPQVPINDDDRRHLSIALGELGLPIPSEWTVAESEPEGPRLPEGWQWRLFTLPPVPRENRPGRCATEPAAAISRVHRRKRRSAGLAALLAAGQLPLPFPPEESAASAIYWGLLESGAVQVDAPTWQWPIPANFYELIPAYGGQQ